MNYCMTYLLNTLRLKCPIILYPLELKNLYNIRLIMLQIDVQMYLRYRCTPSNVLKVFLVISWEKPSTFIWRKLPCTVNKAFLCIIFPSAAYLKCIINNNIVGFDYWFLYALLLPWFGLPVIRAYHLIGWTSSAHWYQPADNMCPRWM